MFIIIIEQIPIMYKNYENRVREFITEMTNPASKIVVKDLTEKVENARTQIIKENSLKKPFIFKGYTTELDRVRNTERNNKLLYNLPDYPEKKSPIKQNSLSPLRINYHLDEKINEINKNKDKNLLNNSLGKTRLPNARRMSITEKRQLNDLIKKDAIIQPQMRFRARTDLERVYDALNGKYIKNNEREIVERQLRKINLFDYKKPKELLKNKSPGKSNKFSKKIQDMKKSQQNIYGNAKIYYEPKNTDKKSWMRNNNLNREAMGILSNYHIKTHFKATKEIAEYQTDNDDLDIKTNDKKSCFLLPNIIPKKTISYMSRNSSNPEDALNFSEDYEENERYETINENEYNRQKNNNPIIKGDKIRFDKNKMQFLEKIAFLKEKEEGKHKDTKNNMEEEDEDITNNFGNNICNEGLNMVAKKILRECNVTSPKSRYNNTTHKTNEGKAMITRGLSIEEFRDKYNLVI